MASLSLLAWEWREDTSSLVVLMTPLHPGVPLTTRQCTKYLGIAYHNTTISHPIHRDPFMPIYFRKIYKVIKTVHKSSSYNSLILHVKSSFFFFFYKKVSQSHSSDFFTPTVPDEGQQPIHNLHLKRGPMTG